MRFRAGTLKTQRDSIVAELAADTPPNGDHTASRHLGCPSGIVVLLEPGLRDLNPEASERFSQGGKSSRRYGFVTEWRFTALV